MSSGRPHNLKTEQFDMDSFFDFNQGTSPVTASSSKMDATPKTASQDWNNVNPFDQEEQRQRFNGPSHDYNLHKQQVGLPMGSMHNVPMQNSIDGYNSGFGDMTFDGGMGGFNSGIDLDADMNMDFNNPQSAMPPMFFPPPNSSSQADNFVDPTSIGGDEPTSNVGRLWPGMHSQQAHQAAMAKAAQVQQVQQRQMKIQAQHAQYRQAADGLPRTQAGQPSNGKRPSHVTEPHVEESISRLLSQMRQNNHVSPDDETSPSGGMLPHIARMKKDEDDMDEDERLLASEDGKKLSSKERRQLRNKVSARAFRSRRKEYIGQLEGEVALKTQESTTLRNENQALMQENERYRGLIETLLRHPAFTPFIQDISNDPSMLAQLQQGPPPQQQQPQQSATPQPAPQQQSQPQPQPDAKPDFLNFDASQLQVPSQPTSQPQQQTERVGLATIPETDFSKLNLNGFQGMNFNNYQRVNAFAVTELPQGPDPADLTFSPASLLASATSTASLDVLLAKLDGAARNLDDHTAVRSLHCEYRKAISLRIGFGVGLSRPLYDHYDLTTHDRLRSALRFYSTPTSSLRKEGGDRAETQSPLDILQELGQTPASKEKETTPTRGDKKDKQEEQPQASFVPRLKQYVLEDPTERWRGKKRIEVTGRIRASARDESPATASPDTQQRRQAKAPVNEIAWTARHASTLRPPYQDQETHQAYRQPDYVRKGMRNWAQILTTPSADTPGTTILLHFDNKRYLVGSLAEGTQRACVQMGARLLKVQECFLTGRTEWKNTGGLIGMILTLADAAHSSRESTLEEAVGRAKTKARKLGLESESERWRELVEEAKQGVPEARLTVFGPGNLNFSMATARRFVFRKGMPVDLHEVDDKRANTNAQKTNGRGEGEDEWEPYWADENIKVWPMSISPAPSRPVTRNGAGQVSPRKRSIDEVYLDERAKTTAPNGTLQTPATDPSLLSQADKDALTSKAVVNEMFNSSWRLDTLYETPLSQVNLPATIFVRNPETKKVEKYRGPLPGSGKEIADPEMTVLVRKPWPGALVESLPPTQPKKEAMSYIIKNHMQRGKFFPNKAQELKVEKGQKWSQLQRGESVLNADGETIAPEMVLGEPKAGGGIAVVDLPDKSYIDALIARPEWRQKRVMDGVGAIVWSCGEGVVTDERVVAFMNEVKDIEHIVASPEHCPNGISLDSATAATIRLGKVDPGRYNVPVHETEVNSPAALPGGATVAQRGLIIQTEPKLELQTNQVVPPLSIPEVESEMSAEVLEEASKAQQALTTTSSDPATSAWRDSIPNPDAEITTLGTGSALPSKYRNVSSTLVRVPGWGNILLDAGENTLGQLKRVFPADELKQILQDLRILFISHMHADHHLGTVAVLKAWYTQVHDRQPLPPSDPSTPVQDLLAPGQPKRLTVISEPAMQHWLTEYASVEDFGLSRITPLVISAAKLYRGEGSRLSWFIPPSQLSHIKDPVALEARTQANIIPPSLIGLADAQAVLVVHCHGARAVSLTLPSGFKVSYSGDCRPSKAFTEIGKGSTVCIHEATFDDELKGDAQAKNHSTTSEALGVAQGMRAKACVLTHFSQRYQKMPVLESAGANSGGEESVKVAVDEPPALPENEEVGDEGGDSELAGDDDVAQTFPDQPTSSSTTATYTPISATTDRTTGPTPTHPPTGKPPSAEPVRFKLASDMKVAVAFDYMRVKVGEIWQMEKFTPALVKLFAEEEKKGEEGKAERAKVEAEKGKGKREKKVKGKKSREDV